TLSLIHLRVWIFVRDLRIEGWNWVYNWRIYPCNFEIDIMQTPSLQKCGNTIERKVFSGNFFMFFYFRFTDSDVQSCLNFAGITKACIIWTLKQDPLALMNITGLMAQIIIFTKFLVGLILAPHNKMQLAYT
ncbi:hypothetical protein ACJX0J_009109, partial [Zea mays]